MKIKIYIFILFENILNKVREVFKAMTNNCEMLKPQWPSKGHFGTVVVKNTLNFSAAVVWPLVWLNVGHSLKGNLLKTICQT